MAKSKDENGTNGGNKDEGKTPRMLRPMRKKRIKIRIRGTSPLMEHQWDEKAKDMMRAKHAGKKTKERSVRDPKQECENAMYRTADGKPGAPGMAIKASLIGAAHKDIGIEKTLVKKAVFLITDDPKRVLPFVFDETHAPEMDESPVRVGQGSTDLRYRPLFKEWAVDTEWEIDEELITVDDLLTLIDRAGFGVGICEWRPERGGEYGRFEVDRNHQIQEEII